MLGGVFGLGWQPVDTAFASSENFGWFWRPGEKFPLEMIVIPAEECASFVTRCRPSWLCKNVYRQTKKKLRFVFLAVLQTIEVSPHPEQADPTLELQAKSKCY